MHVANLNDKTPEAEDLGKKAIDQTVSALIGYQDAWQSFTKARIAFYGACVLISLNMAQASLAPFVDKEK